MLYTIATRFRELDLLGKQPDYTKIELMKPARHFDLTRFLLHYSMLTKVSMWAIVPHFAKLRYLQRRMTCSYHIFPIKCI